MGNGMGVALFICGSLSSAAWAQVAHVVDRPYVTDPAHGSTQSAASPHIYVGKESGVGKPTCTQGHVIDQAVVQLHSDYSDGDGELTFGAQLPDGPCGTAGDHNVTSHLLNPQTPNATFSWSFGPGTTIPDSIAFNPESDTGGPLAAQRWEGDRIHLHLSDGRGPGRNGLAPGLAGLLRARLRCAGGAWSQWSRWSYFVPSSTGALAHWKIPATVSIAGVSNLPPAVHTIPFAAPPTLTFREVPGGSALGSYVWQGGAWVPISAPAPSTGKIVAMDLYQGTAADAYFLVPGDASPIVTLSNGESFPLWMADVGLVADGTTKRIWITETGSTAVDNVFADTPQQIQPIADAPMPWVVHESLRATANIEELGMFPSPVMDLARVPLDLQSPGGPLCYVLLANGEIWAWKDGTPSWNRLVPPRRPIAFNPTKDLSPRSLALYAPTAGAWELYLTEAGGGTASLYRLPLEPGGLAINPAKEKQFKFPGAVSLADAQINTVRLGRAEGDQDSLYLSFASYGDLLDPSTPGGKIVRIKRAELQDSISLTNRIWATGFRQNWSLTWVPLSTGAWACLGTDVGISVDRIHNLLQGGNYGWGTQFFDDRAFRGNHAYLFEGNGICPTGIAAKVQYDPDFARPDALLYACLFGSGGYGGSANPWGGHIFEFESDVPDEFSKVHPTLGGQPVVRYAGVMERCPISIAVGEGGLLFGTFDGFYGSETTGRLYRVTIY